MMPPAPSNDQALPVTNAPESVPPLGLDGYCPVQLTEKSQWTPGNPAWAHIHRGRTYLFAGAEQQQRFLAAPDRYAPVYSGDDIVLAIEQGRIQPGTREHGLFFHGHIICSTPKTAWRSSRRTPASTWNICGSRPKPTPTGRKPWPEQPVKTAPFFCLRHLNITA